MTKYSVALNVHGSDFGEFYRVADVARERAAQRDEIQRLRDENARLIERATRLAAALEDAVADRKGVR